MARNMVGVGQGHPLDNWMIKGTAEAFYRHIVLTYFIATLRPGEMLSGDLFLSVDLGFVSESICEEEDKTPNPCRSMALSDAKKFPIMRSKASPSASG